jgi:hypothetical protein
VDGSKPLRWFAIAPTHSPFCHASFILPSSQIASVPPLFAGKVNSEQAK